uniref:Vacuolar protein sorting-associated protein 8 central domain-containing protein n=1 Tax=Acrobeloides nanus TaxID=290746 RepID=A0A914D570_9BILA
MSSIATPDDDGSDRWLEIDDNLSLPTQTVDEILAERGVFDEDLSYDYDEDNFFLLGRSDPNLASSLSYQLDSPIVIEKQNSISHQIISVKDRPLGGCPSCVSISSISRLIAIGTSRGSTLLFELENGRLAQYVPPGSDYGSVSCVEFSPDGVRLSIGYSRGAIRVVDCRNGKILEEFSEAVQPGRGILHIQYVTRRSLVVVDSGGSVYEFREKAPKNKRVRCVFTGSRGEVVNVVVIDSEGVVLLVSLRQVLIISTKRGTVLSHLRLTGPPNAPPIIEWRQKVVPVTSRSIVKDVRICIARGQEIRIHQLQSTANDALVCPLVKAFLLDNPIINLKWMDDHHFLVFDTREQLHLIDAHRGNVLSTVSINNMELIYNSADYKGLATGGNVSEALKALAENVCYQSMVCANGQVYVIGQDALWSITLLDQVAQLELLEEKDDIASALLYITDIYTGRVRDRTRNSDLRNRVSKRLIELVIRLLNLTIEGLTNGKIAELVDHYKRHISILLRVCTSTSHFDLLYNTVYRRLEKDPLARSIFLELMEEFISEGLLDQPPPALIHDFLSHLIAEGQLSQFESAVTNVPIDRLDIHQVITTCRQNQLFDGIAYVMNNALFDYIGPMEEMFENLRNFADKGLLSDCEIAQGNKLLLYLSCCLAGRGYPHGTLHEHLIEVVPFETYKFMVALHPNKSSIPTSSADTNGYTIENYPHLRLLLKFDAQQFFNVICTCVDAPIFANDPGRLKRFVDILLSIIEADEWDEYASLLLAFVVHLLQKNVIPIELSTLDKIIEVSLRPKPYGVRTQEMIEQNVIDLVNMVPELNQEKILEMAQEVSYVQILSFIYTTRKDFASLLECCLANKKDPSQIFDIISDLWKTLRNDDLERVKRFVKTSIEKLNQIDSYRTGELLLENFIEMLRDFKAMAFPLLRDCFVIRREKGSHTISGDEDLDENLFNAYFSGLLENSHANSDEDHERLDHELVDVLNYWLPLGSRTDLCLNISVQHNLLHCTVALLNAREFFSRAFQTLFDSLEECRNHPQKLVQRIDEIMKLANAHPQESAREEWLIQVFHFLLSTISDEDRTLNSRLGDIVTIVVENGFVGAEKIVDSLFSHSVFQNAPYSTFSQLIRKLILSCQVEEIMLKNTIECVQLEWIDDLNKMISSSKRLVAPLIDTDVCIVCMKPLTKSFKLFNCGHMIHIECADQLNEKFCLCNIENPLDVQKRIPENLPKIEAPLRLANTQKAVNILNSENLRLNTGPPLPPSIRNPFDEDD